MFDKKQINLARTLIQTYGMKTDLFVTIIFKEVKSMSTPMFYSTLDASFDTYSEMFNHLPARRNSFVDSAV